MTSNSEQHEESGRPPKPAGGDAAARLRQHLASQFSDEEVEEQLRQAQLDETPPAAETGPETSGEGA